MLIRSPERPERAERLMAYERRIKEPHTRNGQVRWYTSRPEGVDNMKVNEEIVALKK